MYTVVCILIKIDLTQKHTYAYVDDLYYVIVFTSLGTALSFPLDRLGLFGPSRLVLAFSRPKEITQDILSHPGLHLPLQHGEKRPAHKK